MISVATVEKARQTIGDGVQDNLVYVMRDRAERIGRMLNERVALVDSIVRTESFRASIGNEQEKVEDRDGRMNIAQFDARLAELHDFVATWYESLLAYGAPKADYTFTLPAIPAVPKSKGPMTSLQLVKDMITKGGRP